MLRRLAMLALLTLAACSEDGGTAPGPDAELPALVLTRAAGVPGSVLVVSIAGVDGLPEEPALFFGDREALVRVDSLGGLIAAVPLFLDGEGAEALPEGPVDVTLHDGEARVAEALAAFTVQPLPEAEGALDDVADALETVAGGLAGLNAVLEPTVGEPQAWARASVTALGEILTADDPRSVRGGLAALREENPEMLAVLEGLIVSSGALESLQATARAMSELELPAPGPMVGAPGMASRDVTGRVGPATVTQLTDFELATRMQVYAMVRDFGEQVIGQTATEWADWTGLAVGLAGIPFDIPYVGSVSAALGVASFAVNNVALAFLPAQVESFELIVADSLVVAGTAAETEVRITAKNRTVPITVLDLVDLVLNAIGSWGTGTGAPQQFSRRSFEEAVESAVGFYMDNLRGALAAYGQAHPGSDFDFDVASIPEYRWTAQVSDTRLVSPRSFTPAVIDANGDGILAWRAAQGAEGEGRIYASMNVGPEARLISGIGGYEYNGGPFGDDILNTDTRTVLVGPELVVTASMDPEISPGGLNGLEVRAGTLTATGDTIWRSGYDVSLAVTGGTVEDPSGQTGEGGRFDTFVSLSDGSDRVEVTATVTAPSGFSEEASAAADAETPSMGAVSIVRSYQNAAALAQARTLGDEPRQFENEYTTEAGSFVRSYSVSAVTSEATASASVDHQSAIQQPGGDVLLSYSLAGSLSANGSSPDQANRNALATAGGTAHVTFAVTEGTVYLEFNTTQEMTGDWVGGVHLQAISPEGVRTTVYEHQYDDPGTQEASGEVFGLEPGMEYFFSVSFSATARVGDWQTDGVPASSGSYSVEMNVTSAVPSGEE